MDTFDRGRFGVLDVLDVGSSGWSYLRLWGIPGDPRRAGDSRRGLHGGHLQESTFGRPGVGDGGQSQDKGPKRFDLRGTYIGRSGSPEVHPHLHLFDTPPIQTPNPPPPGAPLHPATPRLYLSGTRSAPYGFHGGHRGLHRARDGRTLGLPRDLPEVRNLRVFYNQNFKSVRADNNPGSPQVLYPVAEVAAILNVSPPVPLGPHH